MTAAAACIDIRVNRDQKYGRGETYRGIMTATALLCGRNVIADLRRSDTRRMTSCAVIRIDSNMSKDDAGEAAEVVNVMTA